MSKQPAAQQLTIERYTLVAVLVDDVPDLWGQVLDKTSNEFEIHTGKFCKGVISVQPDRLIYGVKMDGLCENPQRKFVEEEPTIVAELWAQILVREGLIRPDRLPPTIPPKTGWKIPIQKDVLALILSNGNNPLNELRWGVVASDEKKGIYKVQVGRFPFMHGILNVRPDRIVPILEKSGHKYPRHALIHHRSVLQKKLEMRMFEIEPSLDLDEALFSPMDTLRAAGILLYRSDLVLAAD